MVLLRALTAAILAFAGLVNTQSSTGNSVLVVLDKELKKESFSAFFGGLESAFRIALLPAVLLLTERNSQSAGMNLRSANQALLHPSWLHTMYRNSAMSSSSRRLRNVCHSPSTSPLQSSSLPLLDIGM